MHCKFTFPALLLPVLPIFHYNGHVIKKEYITLADTTSPKQICDTSTFRITYKANIGSWLMGAKSLPGDEVICAGQSNTNGNYDGWLMKSDKFGNILWTKDYGSNNNDYLRSVINTNDGGFLAVGSIGNSGSTPVHVDGHAWAIKVDALGNIVWSYELNFSPSDMQRAYQTKDSGFVLVASVNLAGSATGIIIIKIKNDGTLQWMKEYSDGSTSSGYFIKQTLDGNFVVSGFVYGIGAGLHDGFLMKVSNIDGSLMWLKTYGTPGDEVIDCFDEDANGNLYLSMLWDDIQASIIKTNANGDVIWTKLYTTSFPTSRGNVIEITSSQDILLNFMNNDRFTGGGVMKISTAGTLEWAYDYHPSGGDTYSQFSIDQLASHNGFLIAGTANIGSANDFEGYLAKTDENGKVGSCAIKPVQVTVSDVTPTVQDHQWSNVSSPTDWEPVNVFTITPAITKTYICPQCCVSSNTTIDTAICQGETYKLPDDSVVSQAGTYAVKFTSSTGCDSIITTHLTINPAYHITVQDSICPHQSYTLPDGKVTDTAGIYVSPLHTYKGCDSIITTDLSFKGPVNIQYPDSICEGTSLILPNGTRVTEPGDYTVDLPSATGCDTLAVYHVFMKYPPVVHLNGDTCLIAGQSMWLHAGDGYPHYEWQDGSTDSTMHISDPGTYWVKVSNSCGSVTDSAKVTNDCLPDIYVPSAFTPNGDGMNDIFRILNVHGQKLILFNIYNRWGKTVFHTANISRGWDGSFKGNPQPIGAYIYLIKIINLAGQEKTYKGSVLLIR
jgi:gliding motility-associated-like protein